MAVIVKLGSNDPGKRPLPKSSAHAASPAGIRGGVAEAGKWFRDRRILAAIGATLVLLVMWTVLNLQAPKPVEFPQTRATVDEYDPSKEAQPNPAQQQNQAPAYDPN